MDNGTLALVIVLVFVGGAALLAIIGAILGSIDMSQWFP